MLGYHGKTSKQSKLLGVRFCLNTVVREVNEVIYILEVQFCQMTLVRELCEVRYILEVRFCLITGPL